MLFYVLNSTDKPCLVVLFSLLQVVIFPWLHYSSCSLILFHYGWINKCLAIKAMIKKLIIEKTLIVIRLPNKYCLSCDNHDCICKYLVREISKVLRAKMSLRQRGIKNFARYKRKISQLYHTQTFTNWNKIIIQQISVISWYNPNEYLYIYHCVYCDFYRMTFLWLAVVFVGEVWLLWYFTSAICCPVDVYIVCFVCVCFFVQWSLSIYSS